MGLLGVWEDEEKGVNAAKTMWRKMLQRRKLGPEGHASTGSKVVRG
jgi:hypothetical protein